jgi:predicted HicB family RNase H-like nuclease
MKDVFDYKGYLGSAEVDIEGKALVGKLLFIKDVITYSARGTPSDLEAAFREAVDDYLQTCADLGDEPDTPCKGSFNVRVGPELHREVALAARVGKLGLNEFVCQALEAAVSQPPTPQLVEHVHTHRHVLVRAEHPTVQFLTSGRPAVLKESYATTHQ